MTVRAFPNRAVPRASGRRAAKPRVGAGDALAQVERAAHALHLALKDELARMADQHPALSLWLTTALWMLEMAAKDLAAEPDRERRRAGVEAALMHTMRVSAGLELASTMGALDVQPDRFDARLGVILTKLERARA